jgi:hypothetical protein
MYVDNYIQPLQYQFHHLFVSILVGQRCIYTNCGLFKAVTTGRKHMFYTPYRNCKLDLVWSGKLLLALVLLLPSHARLMTIFCCFAD